MKKIRLNVLGQSYSQMQADAYVLILEVENTKLRIPIIIGSFEAQAIAIQLENIKTPRPLTHDLFVNLSTQFGIYLKEVFIYKFKEGVFYSRLIFQDNERTVEIESRTSDGVALALRYNCPIFTTEEIIKKTGIVIQFESETSNEDEPVTQHTDNPESSENLEDKTVEELQEMLKKAIDLEEYEKASLINKVLNKKK